MKLYGVEQYLPPRAIKLLDSNNSLDHEIFLEIYRPSIPAFEYGRFVIRMEIKTYREVTESYLYLAGTPWEIWHEEGNRLYNIQHPRRLTI